MFKDEHLDAVGFQSSWKEQRQTEECSTQTKKVKCKEAETQLCDSADKQCQAVPQKFSDLEIQHDDSPELAAFLKKIEPALYKELDKNAKSQAFKGFQVSWEEESKAVREEYVLTHAKLKEELQVTGLSWNSSGSVIAASYGRFDHENICTHKSVLCTWNINSRTLDRNKASTVLEQFCCLMSLAFHPTNPAWLAAGNFNGEIFLWDLSLDDDPLIGGCGMGHKDSHREPVAKLQWILDPQSRAKSYKLVSVSGDGKILVWNFDQQLKQLTLSEGFLVTAQNLPKSLRGKGSRPNREVGLTCLSCSHYEDNSFIVGSESGIIFKCTRGSSEILISADDEKGCSVPLMSPKTLSYKPHIGPINAIDYSPFHQQAFLSVAMDESIRIWNALETQPIKILEPGQGPLLCCAWSPVRPMVIAVTTEKGQLLLYDLKSGYALPIQALQASKRNAPIFACSFNRQCTHLLATGDSFGYVHIFHLDDDLATQDPREVEHFVSMLATSE